MIDQHYLSAFVECILSLTMTAFEILNLLIIFAYMYIISDVGVGGIGIINPHNSSIVMYMYMAW